MPAIHVILGLPGSGKTTKAKAFANDRIVRVNRDDIRGMLWDGAYSAEKEAIVKSVWDATIATALAAGLDVVIDDAGMLDPKKQALLAEQCKGCEIIYDRSCLSVPIEECIKRDLKRPNSVGAEVIRSFADRYLPQPQPPVRDPNKTDAIIVDVDGVLAIMGDRKPLDYMAAGGDTLNPIVAKILANYPTDKEVIIVTGREEHSREVLIDWLNRNFVVYDESLVYMRPDGDRTSGDKLKENLLTTLILPNFNIELAIDDDPRVVSMYRRYGLSTMQVSGVK